MLRPRLVIRNGARRGRYAPTAVEMIWGITSLNGVRCRPPRRVKHRTCTSFRSRRRVSVVFLASLCIGVPLLGPCFLGGRVVSVGERLRLRAAGIAATVGVLLVVSGLAAPGAQAVIRWDAPPAPVALVGPPEKPTAAGAFVAVAPFRALDTRNSSPAGADGTVSFQVGGVNGIPADAAAVVFNLTVTAPQSFGYVTAFPSGTDRPDSSNLNFAAGQTIPNSVTVPVGADGKVLLFNRSSGTTQLIADVSGYYLPGTPTAAGAFVTVAPSRFLDTRTASPVVADGTMSFQVGGVKGIPANAAAVVFNLTVTDPRSFGYIAAYASGTDRPNSSNLNFATGQTIPNSVTVPVGADGKVTLFNRSSGTTQLIADVSGYYLPGTPTVPGAFVPVAPSRFLDMRTTGPVWSDGVASFRVGGVNGIPSNAAAVVFNLTVNAPESFGFVTAYASASARPNSSNLNFTAGQTVPNAVTSPVGVDGKVMLFNRSSGATTLIADVSGYFLPGAATSSALTWGDNKTSQLGNGTNPYLATPVSLSGLTGVKSLVSSGDTTYALLKDGTVRAWGNNDSGQLGNGTTADSGMPVQVTGLTGVVSITADFSTAYALKSDGTVWAWGSNAFGTLGTGYFQGRSTPLQIAGLTGVTSVTVNRGSVYALLADGTVQSWGLNMSGELGDGTKTSTTTPALVTGLAGVASVAAGDGYAFAVLTDGTVRAWGANPEGQLGSGTTTSSSTPVPVVGLTGVASIAAQGVGVYALLADGTVRAWGPNRYGQLGNGTTTASSTPVQVAGLTGVASIATKYEIAYAVGKDGTVRAWGNNYGDFLGTGGPQIVSTPLQVNGIAGVASLIIDGYTSYALLADGTVRARGANESGQLGIGTANAQSSTPVQVAGLAGAVSIAAGSGSAFALLGDGTVKVWGDNYNHQLGTGGSTSFSSLPVRVPGLTGVTSVAQGLGSKYALLADGTVWAWGANSHGELGNGTTDGSSTPVQVSGLTGVKAIAAYQNSAYAVLADGTVSAWGSNFYGQLGNGTQSTNGTSTPVQVPGLAGVADITAGSEGRSVFALLVDGTVWAWGDNGSGQLGDGSRTSSYVPVQVSGLYGVASIAAAESTTYALLADGTVRAWGANGVGQLGNGATSSWSAVPVQVSGLMRVTSIAATKGNTAFAVLADGTVRSWGYSYSGELGTGSLDSSNIPVQVTGLRGAVSITAARETVYALLADGTVSAWGSNRNGRLGSGTVYGGSVPVKVQGLVGVASITTTPDTEYGTTGSTYAVLTDGTVRAWGYNANGQLGDGTTNDSNFPVKVQGLAGVTRLGL